MKKWKLTINWIGIDKANAIDNLTYLLSQIGLKNMIEEDKS